MLFVGDRGAQYTIPALPRVFAFIHNPETNTWVHAAGYDVPSVFASSGPVGDKKLFAFAHRTTTEAWVEVQNSLLRDARITLPGPNYAEHIDLVDERLIISTGDRTMNAIVYRRQ